MMRLHEFTKLPETDETAPESFNNVPQSSPALLHGNNSELRTATDSKFDETLSAIQLKDGRQSWIVLIAMFGSLALIAGYFRIFGLIYTEILISYPDTSVTMAGLAFALLAGCKNVLAPVASVVINVIGIRSAMCIGSLLCFFALLLSFFCSTVLQLSLTLGAMMGFGCCLNEQTQVVIIADYFDKKISTANGIRVAGIPAGGMVFPFIFVYLLDAFGITMMRLILAAIMLHLLVFVVVIPPVKAHQSIQILKTIRREKQIPDEEKHLLFSRLKSSLILDSSKKRRKPLKFGYFLDPVFWVFIFTVIGVAISMPSLFYYLPIYGTSIGLTPSENSILLVTQSGLDLGIKLIMGWLNDKNLYKKTHGFVVCLVAGGVGTILMGKCTSLWSLICAATLSSFASSAFLVFLNVILTEQFGKESISDTWGFLRMIHGTCNLAFPPLLGYLIDVYGYFATFVTMGTGLILAGLILLTEPIVIKLTNSDIVIT